MGSASSHYRRLDITVPQKLGAASSSPEQIATRSGTRQNRLKTTKEPADNNGEVIETVQRVTRWNALAMLDAGATLLARSSTHARRDSRCRTRNGPNRLGPGG